MRHRGRPQRSLPLAPDPQDGALGQEGLHSHPASATRHAPAPVQVRTDEVSIRLLCGAHSARLLGCSIKQRAIKAEGLRFAIVDSMCLLGFSASELLDDGK